MVGSREEKIAQSTRMGTINVPLTQIKLLPALLGKTDVLKVLQLLPGVQTGGKGQSRLYVRGGSPGQNLILLDGTPVYNPSTCSASSRCSMPMPSITGSSLSGDLPARYGGRLSSVPDISMKEGNRQAFHGEGAVGLVASKLTLEGPIKKDTASFIISARRPSLDVLARPIIGAAAANGGSATIGYFFHDPNGELN
ncbi:TonB-dependent receptor plug domain-containing protein [Hymenobacter algoricola]|uniref:TonB-dependent receptor plug domain-containing protein n=1 Tax=Hymenobacter algoricola TaxID=486267 RepID=A0ABP7N835_9BACT